MLSLVHVLYQHCRQRLDKLLVKSSFKYTMGLNQGFKP